MSKKRQDNPGAAAVPAADRIWEREPDKVRKFLSQRPDFEQLCAEVAYTLRKRLTDAGIEISSITHRAKTLDSFLDKLRRKSYNDPFTEVTDFAGTRVVCLYPDDLKRIADLIASEFEILEKDDKADEKQPDEFGYNATHFIVRLGKGSSGARYDDLKTFVCEIQVRTVLQDAWAIIQHHLTYKQESQIPRALQRKLNSLAGLFETADDQFERIRTERESYLADVRNSADTPQFLDHEMNLDSFAEFLKWKYPEIPLEAFDGQLRMLFDWIDTHKYHTLREVESLMNATNAERDQIRREIGQTVAKPQGASAVPASIEAYWAFYLAESEFSGANAADELWKESLNRHRTKFLEVK